MPLEADLIRVPAATPGWYTACGNWRSAVASERMQAVLMVGSGRSELIQYGAMLLLLLGVQQVEIAPVTPVATALKPRCCCYFLQGGTVKTPDRLSRSNLRIRRYNIGDHATKPESSYETTVTRHYLY